MRCVNCGGFSFGIICRQCSRILSEFSLQKRECFGIKVYYFYGYSEISNLIHSKHKEYGKFVYQKLANLTFKKFANQKFGYKINAIPLDDNVKSGYSHCAILAKALKSSEITPVFNCLRANSDVKYSGKPLEYRIKHRRNFTLNKIPKYPVILVDDIITTGSTMYEAAQICKKSGIEVVLGLVLANAQE